MKMDVSVYSICESAISILTEILSSHNEQPLLEIDEPEEENTPEGILSQEQLGSLDIQIDS